LRVKRLEMFLAVEWSLEKDGKNITIKVVGHHVSILGPLSIIPFLGLA
jgi:hypothetical protein